ncbi:MAG: hypothetical protein LBS09_01645 [Bacteroidales bacterium]|nr:hypothetical protein [Bacteroidales bacterium]
MRRFLKILLDYRITASELIHNLSVEPQFLEEVVKKITVNTTEMFRDPLMWTDLRKNVLPQLSQKHTINIWHSGCSSGQEVYSMIILLAEMGLSDKANLYATDLNTDVLEAAKKGVYKYRFNAGYLDNFDKVFVNNNPLIDKGEIYRKYFDIDVATDRIKIHPNLLEKPVFAKHDLVNEDNPFGVRFDLIMCRNVIIYFNYHLQGRLFTMFHRNLTDSGILVMGVHESIHGEFLSLFEKSNYHYQKK